MTDKLISTDAALKLVLQHKLTPATEEVDLLKAVGRVLAKPVIADRGFPPFNRVTMDGVAINTSSFSDKKVAFPIENLQSAGTAQVSLIDKHNCIEVMTGAVLPANTDAVIPYEQLQIENGIARIQAETVLPFQFVHLQGTDALVGDVLIASNAYITPAMIGTMASVGLSKVWVLKLPKIAICATGNELVPIETTPLPHQIRISNSYMLAAELLKEGITATLLHLPDDFKQMETQLQPLIKEYDVIFFSGAVSKGKFDYLPAVLAELGMRQIFHKVAQKPGKPFLFGSFLQQAIVFGFPGNPVSMFVCYHYYFKKWLQATYDIIPAAMKAQLTKEIIFKPELTYLQPVKLSASEGILTAAPINTSGSGDLTSILNADALVVLPPNRQTYHSGEAFPIIKLN